MHLVEFWSIIIMYLCAYFYGLRMLIQLISFLMTFCIRLETSITGKVLNKKSSLMSQSKFDKKFGQSFVFIASTPLNSLNCLLPIALNSLKLSCLSSDFDSLNFLLGIFFCWDIFWQIYLLCLWACSFSCFQLTKTKSLISWCWPELFVYLTLFIFDCKLKAAGIRCPTPYLLRLHVLVMEFIGITFVLNFTIKFDDSSFLEYN